MKLISLTCKVSRILLVLSFALIYNSVSAAPIFSTEAIFENPLPVTADTSIVAGVDPLDADNATSTFSWGTPRVGVPTDTQSILTFTGLNDQPGSLTVGSQTLVGIMTFFNGTISLGSEALTVDLSIAGSNCDSIDGDCDAVFDRDPLSPTYNPNFGDLAMSLITTPNNSTNADPALAEIENSDAFCFTLPGVGEVEQCYWAAENNDELFDALVDPLGNPYGTNSVIGTSYAFVAEVGSLIIREVIPVSSGAFVTIGRDPTLNVIARVPEPTTLALFGLGLLGFGLRKRKT